MTGRVVTCPAHGRPDPTPPPPKRPPSRTRDRRVASGAAHPHRGARLTPARALCPAPGRRANPNRPRHRNRRERVDRAENLPAVLVAILRRYALESSPRELGAARQAAEQARRSQPPPTPCPHGDPNGCTAYPFCRRGLADPGGERCHQCSPSTVPKAGGE